LRNKEGTTQALNQSGNENEERKCPERGRY
jgi:hypothetical protein